MSAQVGCGTYTAEVWTRGGGERITLGSAAGLPVKSGSWSRDTDVTTRHELVIASNPDCCGLLATIRPYAHEIHLYRHPAPNRAGELVYVGVVRPGMKDKPNPQAPEVIVPIADLTHWWQVRWVHSDHDWTTETGSGPLSLIEQFRILHEDAMAPDTSPNIELHITAGGTASGERRVLEAEHRPVFTPLSELARDGVDFSACSTPSHPRRVLVGAPELSVTVVATLLDDHWQQPPDAETGTVATRIGVAGAGGGENGDDVWGEASSSPAARDFYGLVERRFDENLIESNDSAAQAARYRRGLIGERSPIRMDGGVLLPSAPLDLVNTCAGSHVIVSRGGCLSVVDEYRIQTISVEFDGEGERVALALRPLSDEGEESL